MAAKLKKGDRVFILAGKDKGKEGEIVQILGSDKAIVQGINLVKKHKKPSQEDEGGIVDQEKPIHKSNLMLIDPKSKKPTKIGFKQNKKGVIARFAKKSGELITVPFIRPVSIKEPVDTVCLKRGILFFSVKSAIDSLNKKE